MKKFVFPKIGTSMLLAIMVVGVLFFINEQNFDRSTAATLQIEESTKTLAALNRLKGQVANAETGQTQVNLSHQNILELTILTQEKIVAAKNQIQTTLVISRIGILLFAMTGLLAFYLYVRQNAVLVDTALREKESLQRERDQISALVKDRTENLAQLATHLQNMREMERGDLARAMHDELGSLLTTAKLDVARLKSQLSSTVPDAEERFTHLNATLNNIIVMTRNIVEDLRPSSLSHLGLTASLGILALDFEKQHHLVIETDLENIEIYGNAQLAVYRLAQESLTNISKYAKAKNVMLSMHDCDGYISVQVRDDGLGFDKAKVDGTHNGLLGMQHRVEALGGKLIITSMPGYGTHILATIPTTPPTTRPTTTTTFVTSNK